MNKEMRLKLEDFAYNQTIPYCSGCNKKAPTGRCTHCRSDDLMKYLDGSGPEWHIERIIEILISQGVTPIPLDDLNEAFDESINDCDDEIFGFSPSYMLKNVDPVAYELGKRDWISSEEEDGVILQIEDKYYWEHDINSFIDQNYRKPA